MIDHSETGGDKWLRYGNYEERRHGSNAGHSSGVAGVDARRATPPEPRLARWGLAGCRQLDLSNDAFFGVFPTRGRSDRAIMRYSRRGTKKSRLRRFFEDSVAPRTSLSPSIEGLEHEAVVPYLDRIECSGDLVTGRGTPWRADLE